MGSVIVVIPATYLAWVWWYYHELNDSMPGFISAWEAFTGLGKYLTEIHAWKKFGAELAYGYLFMAIGFFAGLRKRR